MIHGIIEDLVRLLNQLSLNTYKPLVGSCYIDLPTELKHLRKGLINIKNNNQKCFLWCHVRHVNPLKDHPGRIARIDKNFANNLNYDGIEFPV